MDKLFAVNSMDKRYSIAVDIGESQVIAMAGRRGASGEVEVIASAKRPMSGVRAGCIENIAQVNAVLSGVIADLELKLGVGIQQVYSGISGESVRSAHHSETVIIKDPNGGVTASDVGELQRLMLDVYAPPADKIIDRYPQRYMSDGVREIDEPIGAFCRSLGVTYNFILCDNEVLKRLRFAFIQAGVVLKRCFANVQMAAEAVSTADERDMGVVVVDMGEGVTNVAVYYHGTLRYIGSIPIGASALDRDLKSLIISERNVSKVRRESGCAIARLADKGSVSIEGRSGRHNIPLYDIATVIESRLSDIIEYVKRELRDSGFETRLPCGVILTGGLANMPYIDELFRLELNIDVRIACPEEGIDKESLDSVDSPEYATVVGILKRAIEMDESSVTDLQSEESADQDQEIEEGEEGEEEQEIPQEPQASKEERVGVTSEGSASQRELFPPEDDSDDEDDEEEDDEENDGAAMSGWFKSMGRKVNDFFTKNSRDDKFDE